MSLNWNISKCKDNEAIKTKEEWPVTETIIFLTINMGIAYIKDEATAREFFRRAAVYEHLRGVMLHSIKREEGKADEMIPRWLTLADFTRRIGLYTNASSISGAKFWRSQVPKWAEKFADESASTEQHEAITKSIQAAA